MVVAPIEGQEVGFLAPEPGRHPYLVRVHGEVDQAAPFESEEKVSPVPVVLVLAHRIGGALSGQRILEFGGDDGDAVDGKRHVDERSAGSCRLPSS